MAIEQGNKIIASEINEYASTSFQQSALIDDEDIKSLYGGSDTIGEGLYIKAEHFQNLGLPGSGGLKGTYDGIDFKKAWEQGLITYIKSTAGWELQFKTNGDNHKIKFSNFGKFGNVVDVFLLGGGGAGHRHGGRGGGGDSSTGKNISLATNVDYTLEIGIGSSTEGVNGGVTSASFYLNGSTPVKVEGGKCGIGGGKYAEIQYATSSSGNFDCAYSLTQSGWNKDVLPYSEGNIIIVPNDWHEMENIKLNGYNVSVLGGYLSEGGSYVYWPVGTFISLQGKVKDLYKNGSSGSGYQAVNLFGELSNTLVGGFGYKPGENGHVAGEDGVRPGQGGSGNLDNAYGGTVFGKGVDGMIAIRNHRS